MKHSTWMSVARTIAENESKCIAWKVCAIIVKDDRLRSTGHNGTPSKQPNCCDVNAHLVQGIKAGNVEAKEAHHHWAKRHEIHAEINAIMYSSPEDRVGATLYCTLQPCEDCAKAIAGSGIKRVIYDQEYHRTPVEDVEILKDAGIEVFKLSDLM